MIERLALPAWKTPPTPLSAWAEQLRAQGLAVDVAPESTASAWLELPALWLRGYAVLQGETVEAINFEIHAPDTSPALQVIETAAARLGWEVHEDEKGEDEDEDD